MVPELKVWAREVCKSPLGAVPDERDEQTPAWQTWCLIAVSSGAGAGGAHPGAQPGNPFMVLAPE